MISKRSLLLAACAIACALIVFAILSIGESGAPGGATADLPAAAARETHAPRPGALAGVDAERTGELQPGAREAVAAAREPDVQAAAEEAPEQRTEVLVLDGIAEVPLPGARILWVGSETVNEHMLGIRGSLDSRERLAERIATETFADAGGRALVGLDETGGFLRVEHGGLVRSLWSHPMPSAFESDALRRQTVRLFPRRALEVQVVDETGVPRADVGVCLRIRATRYYELAALLRGADAQHPAARTPQETEWPIWQGRTQGPEGLLTIEDFDEQVRSYYEARDSGSTSLTDPRLLVDLDLPGDRSSALQLDPTLWDLPRVVLRLPTTGSISLRLVDDSGRPSTLGASARLFSVADAEADAPRPDGRWSREARLDEGALHVDGIELDTEYGVDLRFTDGRANQVEAFAGPDHAQRDLEVTITAGAPRPVLSGTLLNAEGLPLANSWVEISETIEGREFERSGRGVYPVRTDGYGTFQSPLRTLPLPGERCTLVLRYPHTPSDSPIEVVTVISGRNDGGSIRLGTLRLAAPQGGEGR